jgi:hypothetical protein
MGFFNGFSRCLEADSEQSKKRDSGFRFWFPKAGFSRLERPDSAATGGVCENC